MADGQTSIGTLRLTVLIVNGSIMANIDKVGHRGAAHGLTYTKTLHLKGLQGKEGIIYI